MTRLAALALALVVATPVAWAQPGAEPPPPVEPAPEQEQAEPRTRDKIRDLAMRARAKLEEHDITEEVVKRLGAAMAGRARRAIAVGPHVGGLFQFDAKDAVSGGGVTFGLGLYVFDVPTGLQLREVIKERVRKELIAVVAENKDIDVSELVREIVDRVVADVLDGAYGSQRVIPPRGKLLLEGGVLFGDADGIQARLLGSYGIGPIALGVSAAVHHGNSTTTAYLGGEVSFSVTPIGQQRTPVFDLFARLEVGAQSEVPIIATTGLRVLLDVL